MTMVDGSQQLPQNESNEVNNPPPEEVPWHAAYPAPRTAVSSLPRQEILRWFQNGRKVGKEFVLIDVRRTDFEGGTIRGSLNLPAQSLYHTIPTLYTVLSEAKVSDVVWFCGSSRGRGPRAAGWFADYIETQQNSQIRSLVLEGGVKGWAAAGTEYTQLMDGYEASVWSS